MSIMYVREYPDSGMLTGGQPIPIEPGTDQAPVTISATSAQSAAFQNNTRVVRVAVDVVSSIKFGTNPTALANSSLRMSAGQTSDFIVPLGGGLKVAAIVTTV